jgi:sigma-B regulation protein RsbU (phosphoserine phosphatase)
MMPGIDGYESAGGCGPRGHARAADHVLSALEDVENKARGFELGANDYLSKPFEILEVKARVRSLLRAKAYADAGARGAEREMSVAREIQMGLLPSDIRLARPGTELDVGAVSSRPGRSAATCFEVLRADDDTLVVVIGDVMGKGIPASLFMAVTMTLPARSHDSTGSPKEILRRLERRDRRPEPAAPVRDHGVSGVRSSLRAA